MGIFDFLSGQSGQGYAPPSPDQQGWAAFTQAMMPHPSQYKTPAWAIAAQGLAGGSQAFQNANAKQGVASALNSGDMNKAYSSMLQSNDPELQKLAIASKLQTFQPDQQLKLKLLKQLFPQAGDVDPNNPPAGNLGFGGVAPAQGGVGNLTPEQRTALAVVSPEMSNALNAVQTTAQSTPTGKAQAMTAEEAAKRVAQNEEDIKLGTLLTTNYGKAISPDADIGNKIPAATAPGGWLAETKSDIAGNLPGVYGAATGANGHDANMAYGKLQSLLVPTAAEQAHENLQRVTGMEYGKFAQAQGLNATPETRAGIIKQNQSQVSQKIATLQAENDALRKQYNLPPSANAATPLASPAQKPPGMLQMKGVNDPNFALLPKGSQFLDETGQIRIKN